jgi:hypothetical protein
MICTIARRPSGSGASDRGCWYRQVNLKSDAHRQTLGALPDLVSPSISTDHFHFPPTLRMTLYCLPR